ncbi:ROK family protein, partial [Clostridium beijerinckii]|nr:ROK family protein [Clostridium beijerinckii]
LEGTIKPFLKKCEFGNDANKLGALYNYLQRQE